MIDFAFGLAVGVFLTIGSAGVAIGLAGVWIRKAISRML